MQAAPILDLSAIPAAQRAAVLALMDQVAVLTDITRRQEHLIAELNHALHGKRSEKLSEDERREIKEQIEFYKEWREVFQFGSFHRLRGPKDGDGNEVAWMAVSADRRRAAVLVVDGPPRSCR